MRRGRGSNLWARTELSLKSEVSEELTTAEEWIVCVVLC
jgi:hypothetical protein